MGELIKIEVFNIVSDTKVPLNEMMIHKIVCDISICGIAREKSIIFVDDKQYQNIIENGYY